jgi:prepilin-type N-terminal cleavage/methylation domain-containing protein/prepilin-type processing-associated H-X9-DG protein
MKQQPAPAKVKLVKIPMKEFLFTLQPRMFLSKRKGFTLIEILVVVSIVALLAALAYPAIKSAIAASKNAGCMGNLRTLGAAVHSFTADHGGFLPNPTLESGKPRWTIQISPYMTIATNRSERSGRYPFYCPASTINPDPRYNRLSDQLSYAFNSRLSTNSNSIPLVAVQVPSRTLMMVDNKAYKEEPDVNQVLTGSSTTLINEKSLERIPYERHRGHANILFVDGSVQPRKPFSTNNPHPTNTIIQPEKTN